MTAQAKDHDDTDDTEGTDEARHPIRVVATRTGLTPSALRAWERRYGVVEPGRSEGGQRLYSDADIERLSLLKRVTDAGRAISTVAGLSDDELRELVAEDEAARRAVRRWEDRTTPSTNGHPSPEGFLGAALEAVQELDAEGLEATLRRTAVTVGSVPFTDEVMAPLLATIGDRWAEGSLGAAHEHVATAVVRRVLSWVAQPGGDAGGPSVVLGTLPGEQHELGAMLAAVTASLAGWRVTYLGQGLPAAEIAAAAEGVDARMVGLSAVHPAAAPRHAEALAELRRTLDPSVELIVGGAAAADLVDRCALPHIQVVPDLAGFREALARVAGR